jgi:glycosyltransferase involved in cell wall biosynthesis
MQAPLISILIPFKNTASYLKECLDSILNQTYSNWELLIVDDGSDDESYTIVKMYAEKDNRIKLFKNQGKGIIEALRYAYQHSTGELITRMDSDDIMTPNKLKVLSDSLTLKGKNHIAIGQVHYFSKNGIGAGYKSYEEWLNKLIETGNNYSEIYKECVIPSPCWMLHREDLDKIGAFNSDTYPEDYDMTFRCYENDLKCIPCSTILHNWRDYSSRTSRTDEHYAENHFLDLKLHYFLKLNHDSNRPLVIWGAGKKGKTVAKKLTEKVIPFYWICDNPKKIGKDIYGKALLNFEYLNELNKPQSIITVANNEAQQEIKQYMASHNMESMHDYFFFC